MSQIQNMSSKLIALVATAVMVNGVRTVIEPGQKLPTLSPHDERELRKSGAAQNTDDTDEQVKAQALAEAASKEQFEAARQRVAQANESIAVDANDTTTAHAATDSVPTEPTVTTKVPSSSVKAVAKTTAHMPTSEAQATKTATSSS